MLWQLFQKPWPSDYSEIFIFTARRSTFLVDSRVIKLVWSYWNQDYKSTCSVLFNNNTIAVVPKLDSCKKAELIEAWYQFHNQHWLFQKARPFIFLPSLPNVLTFLKLLRLVNMDLARFNACASASVAHFANTIWSKLVRTVRRMPIASTTSSTTSSPTTSVINQCLNFKQHYYWFNYSSILVFLSKPSCN